MSMLGILGSTLFDIAPIAAIIFGFQYLVVRRPIPRLRAVLLGFVFVWVGLSLFLMGLERALFPLGELMATQLTSPEALPERSGEPSSRSWLDYGWVYLFAFSIGAATTIAEPSLVAVGLKAEDVSAGVIRAFPLRVAVALGVAIGISLGALRIVTGFPLHWLILIGYAIVIVQALTAPRIIIPLAFDSGGVTTSTITVPIVAALGLGVASAIPGRSPLVDGFGMIALASVFPIITVMGYAQIAEARRRWLSHDVAEGGLLRRLLRAIGMRKKPGVARPEENP